MCVEHAEIYKERASVSYHAMNLDERRAYNAKHRKPKRKYRRVLTPEEVAERVSLGLPPCEHDDMGTKRWLGICLDCSRPAMVPDSVFCEQHRESRRVSSLAFAKAQVSDAEGHFKRAASQAKTRGRAWAITLDEWIELYDQPCFYCGLSKDVVFGVALDRLDNQRGYERDNRRPVLHALQPDENG